MVATMPDSMAEYLRTDMDCEGLLECFHGLRDLDRYCFTVVVESEAPLTIDEIADEVDRERSTVYRSLQRLLQAGFVQKEQVNYDQGGYYHVFQPTDPDIVADEMQRMLNDWYAKMGQLIHEFRSKYDTTGQPAATVEG
jgi:predicted transcriptional regulator